MDSSGVPTPRMDWDSVNLTDAWRRFCQHVQFMFSGLLGDKSEETFYCSYLLLWVDEKGRDVYNTWTLSADESKKLQPYYEFEEYVMPKANPIFARYKFYKLLVKWYKIELSSPPILQKSERNIKSGL
ncbi:hypothetical protein QQF64_020442 [Cirrhinus molitorella]|uniref:Uncharacterized protein n=1 Tax=Cirrhinus molitorella TaxID=172907 RepID=A0ABR3L969_9TELE